MSAAIDKLIQQINTLNSISEAEKDSLLQQLKKIKSEQRRTDFKWNRLKKDKFIVVNILETALKDIALQKKELEKVNQQLQCQQKELKLKNQVINDNAKKLEDNLAKLEQSYNELEQFAYIASHDLKSPLRIISSYAQLLHKNYYQNLDHKADKYLNFIISEVNRINEVIDSLLQYSRVGFITEKPTQLDLNEVLEQAKLNLAEELESNQAFISVGSLPSIFGIKIILVQLFQNLLQNAIKFRTDMPPHIVIKAQAMDDEKAWKFSFTDNGIGIKKEYQDKVFQPFHQLSPNESSGLGVGLSICKKAVEIHKGDIYFTSVPGEGTTFVFTLYDIQTEALFEVANGGLPHSST